MQRPHPHFPAARKLRRGAPISRGASFVAALAIALAGGTFAAHGKGISDHNSDAPVNYAADRIEVLDKQNRVLLTGNVDITQEELRLRATRATVDYTNDDGVKIQRMNATGNVIVTRDDETATGDVATYDFNSRIITMVGNVVLHRGTDVSRGGRLVINLDSGVSSFVGAAGPQQTVANSATPAGRVSGTFSVPKRKKDQQKDQQKDQ